MKNKTSGLFSRLFDFAKWIDLERSRSIFMYFMMSVKKLFIPKPKTEGETFEEAVLRLKLTDQDLEKKKASLFKLTLLMLCIAFCVFIYTIYQCLYGGILGFIISWMVVFITLVTAFRYHFWYFQIKKRKLGCTLKEWFLQGVLGESA